MKISKILFAILKHFKHKKNNILHLTKKKKSLPLITNKLEKGVKSYNRNYYSLQKQNKHAKSKMNRQQLWQSQGSVSLSSLVHAL